MNYIPFSNGTEAMFWQETNCYRCKRYDCSVRNTLRRCGDISEKSCYKVGGTLCPGKNGNFVHMPTTCHMFTAFIGFKSSRVKNDAPTLFDIDKTGYKL